MNSTVRAWISDRNHTRWNAELPSEPEHTAVWRQYRAERTAALRAQLAAALVAGGSTGSPDSGSGNGGGGGGAPFPAELQRMVWEYARGDFVVLIDAQYGVWDVTTAHRICTLPVEPKPWQMQRQPTCFAVAHGYDSARSVFPRGDGESAAVTAATSAEAERGSALLTPGGYRHRRRDVLLAASAEQVHGWDLDSLALHEPLLAGRRSDVPCGALHWAAPRFVLQNFGVCLLWDWRSKAPLHLPPAAAAAAPVLFSVPTCIVGLRPPVPLASSASSSATTAIAATTTAAAEPDRAFVALLTERGALQVTRVDVQRDGHAPRVVLAECMLFEGRDARVRVATALSESARAVVTTCIVQRLRQQPPDGGGHVGVSSSSSSPVGDSDDPRDSYDPTRDAHAPNTSWGVPFALRDVPAPLVGARVSVTTEVLAHGSYAVVSSPVHVITPPRVSPVRTPYDKCGRPVRAPQSQPQALSTPAPVSAAKPDDPTLGAATSDDADVPLAAGAIDPYSVCDAVLLPAPYADRTFAQSVAAPAPPRFGAGSTAADEDACSDAHAARHQQLLCVATSHGVQLWAVRLRAEDARVDEGAARRLTVNRIVKCGEWLQPVQSVLPAHPSARTSASAGGAAEATAAVAGDPVVDPRAAYRARLAAERNTVHCTPHPNARTTLPTHRDVHKRVAVCGPARVLVTVDGVVELFVVEPVCWPPRHWAHTGSRVRFPAPSAEELKADDAHAAADTRDDGSSLPGRRWLRRDNGGCDAAAEPDPNAPPSGYHAPAALALERPVTLRHVRYARGTAPIATDLVVGLDADTFVTARRAVATAAGEAAAFRAGAFVYDVWQIAGPTAACDGAPAFSCADDVGEDALHSFAPRLLRTLTSPMSQHANVMVAACVPLPL